MRYELIIRPEAEADMAEAFTWYEERREGLGHEFLAEVRAVLDQIEESPLRHSQVISGGPASVGPQVPV